jgi:hypothetical protein
MIERLARPRKARGQFRFATEAKSRIAAPRDVLLAKSHRGLHLLAEDERCLQMPLDALRMAYGSAVVIEPRLPGEPVMEVRIGLERSNLQRIRPALRGRGVNPSEEYDGTHYCVLRFQAPAVALLGLPAEVADLTSGRFSHQILLTGYR